ncbi:unnamed protein product [Effrenium voratum]|nr:unnamed protein product [Effrenium voratum]
MAPTLVLTPRLANSFEAAKAAEKESGAFVVPTAVSLKAHEARLAVPYKRDILRPCDASSTAVSVSASERPRGSFWDSERMVEAKALPRRASPRGRSSLRWMTGMTWALCSDASQRGSVERRVCSGN